jgi:hypothetical protein
MSDEKVPLTCPTCHYVATWIPAKSVFEPALDMYGKCPVITKRLDDHPERRAEVGGNPRLCPEMRNEWVKMIKARAAPPGAPRPI